MPDKENRKVVANSSSEVPNNSQETNFMLVGPTADGMAGQASKDEMGLPQGSKQNKSAGEDAVLKYRQPY